MRTFAICMLSGLYALMTAYSSPVKGVAMSDTDDIVTPTPALSLPGVTLDDIKDCYLGCHFTGTSISETGREGRGCNVRPTPDGKGLRVEFQIHDDTYVKCVVVDLANGVGGVYARKIGTGYKAFSKSVQVGNPFGDVTRRDGYDVFRLFAEPPARRKAGGATLCERCAAKPKHTVIPAPRAIKFTGGTFLWRGKYTPKKERVSSIPAEGYELSVSPGGVKIRASDAAGEFYARQTLAQLGGPSFAAGSDGTKPDPPATLPCCEIKDSPRFKWRGVMIDDVRHFMGKEQVKRTIDEMAKYKLNVFHWHLTDDQSWRIDVPGYPELLDYGDQYSLMTDKKLRVRMPNGPRAGRRYYTADDIREVVAYAKARRVKVVPEIDFPGHFYAVLCAYPEFACKPESVYKQGRWPMVEGWRDGREPMCVANPDAVKFVEAALDAVCDLFPDSEVIHIGGDECHFEFWKDCPKCQAMMQKEGMKRPQELQAWLTRRVVKHLEKRGRRAIGWDEILDAKPGVLPPKTMGMFWFPKRGAARTARAAKAGHELVNSSTHFCYFDFRQGLAGDTHRYIGGNIPLSRVYAFDPLAGISAEAGGKVVGGQCNNWGEFTYDGKDLEWKLWPRGLALAEVLWTYPDPQKRDFAEFERRAATHRDAMVKRGVNAAPVPGVAACSSPAIEDGAVNGGLQPVVVKAVAPDEAKDLVLSGGFSPDKGVAEKSGVIRANPKAARLSERVERKFRAFESESAPGLLTTRTIVDGVVGNYRRMVFSIRNVGAKPVKVEDISFLRGWAPSGASDGYRSGNTDGSVAIFPSKRMFVGVEHPMAKLTVENGRVTAHLPRGFDLGPGETWTFSYVVGRYEGDSPRRDFQAYLNAERAHPYRVMTHYNSWFDLGVHRYTRPWQQRMTEGEAMDVLKAFRAEMGRRGVFIQSYLWDDGWDDWNSLWAFHPGFPNGFKNIAAEAHKDKGASIGAWMSPCGGYAGGLASRVAYSRSKGLVGEKDTQLKMSNPTYYAAFRDRVMDMIKSYDMNLFKFDRMGSGKVDDNGCDATYAPEIDAVVRLMGEMRRAKQDVFINCTVGTWASPYWVMFADSIWRGGGDFGRAGTGTDRQKWLTFRDNKIYDRFVNPCPLFPLNSMMMHGIIVTENGAPRCMDRSASAQSTQDFADEVWMGVGCGTGLQEYYITPRLMCPKWWDILADGVKWLKSNADVMRDVHWIGGDPVGRGGVGVIYGYASAGVGKGVVTVRNPSDRPQTFSGKLSKLLDLTAAQTGAAVKSQKTVYSHDAEIGKVARVSDEFSVRLAPCAMAVVEFDFGK